MKALLLGASGALGRRVAAALAREDDLEVVAPAHDAGADAAREDDVAQMATGCSVVVNCAGPGHRIEVACAGGAVAAGAHYVSLNDDADAALALGALSGAAQDAEVTVVPGCGIAPGLSDLLAWAAGTASPGAREVELTLAVSAREPTGPATTEHLLRMLTRPAVGRSARREDIGPPASDPRLVYMPEPVGWVETFRVPHPEVAALSELHPDLEAAAFRLGITEKPVMDTARAIAASRTAGTERARSLWTRATAPLRPVLANVPPRGPEWSALRADVWAEGRATPTTLGVADRLPNVVVAMVVAATRRLARGDVLRTGVVPVTAAFDPKGMLHELQSRGIRVARLEPVRL